MNNAQFVAIASDAIANNNLELNKRHWNLFIENGVLYSFGRHYPLMFKLGWHLFINNHWYSNTTSKHIWLCITSEAKYVELKNICNSYSYGSCSPSLENVKLSLQETIERLEEQLKHTREWSQKNTYLKARLANTTETLASIS